LVDVSLIEFSSNYFFLKVEGFKIFVLFHSLRESLDF